MACALPLRHDWVSATLLRQLDANLAKFFDNGKSRHSPTSITPLIPKLESIDRPSGPKQERYSTSSTFSGSPPNAFCAKAASMKRSISPSSTAPVFEVDTPVRKSFTI